MTTLGTALDAKHQHERKLFGRVVGATAWYAVLLSLAFVFLLPFFWMLSTSLKDPGMVFAYPIQWIPRPMVWRNFPEAWTVIPFTTFLKNTAFLTLFSMVAQTASSAIASFAFARIPFKGRDVLFVLVLATMMLPPQVTLIPTYIIFAKLKWVDTFKPLLVPTLFGSPYYIFLLRQFFLTIPIDIEDAAFVDGCSRFRIFWNIFLPLSKPAFATVLIFSFMAHWNDFFAPLIYLNSRSRLTLTLGLSLLRDAHSTQWHWMMAIAILMLLPCLALFFIFQGYFVEGITMTGTKG
ncbi:MAG: carbohydrate ABC transporter permease [Anaerolineae bacterium]|jgi:multiple sugar transport system permease protein